MSLKFTAPLLLAASLAAGLATPSLAQSPGRSQGPTVLVHGNYCGPGNNAPLAPIDALDAACARHDACTPDGGLPTKACNLRLQREAASVARDPRQPQELRSMAGLVSVGASLMLAETGRRPAPAMAPTTVAHDPSSPDIASPDSGWSSVPSSDTSDPQTADPDEAGED